MRLAPVPKPRGAKGQLGSANARIRQSDRDENVRLADIVVVEKIYAASFEIVAVQQPAANGDRDSQLMFFTAFAMKGLKGSRVAGSRDALKKTEKRPGKGHQRRRLIKVAPEGTEHPVQ